MKNIIVSILAAIALFFTTSCKADRDHIITVNQLPAAARTFLQDYFSDQNVSFVKKDIELVKTSYEVRLEDGTEIDFNSKGEWDKVDRDTIAVPSALIPQAIAAYVSANFPSQIIVMIDKENYGHEIELGNSLELKFNKKGELIRVDD
ncbi:MAG: PepSY-like domain-containing protein [Bacteroidales bacterium]|nr:PepSY-like domain-containing protein [Bacteroidales bacterium]